MRWPQSLIQYAWEFNAGPFRLNIDPFLPLILALIAWLLKNNYYPAVLPYHVEEAYLVMGIISALLLAISIFVHELGHAAAGHFLNLGIDRIYLFAFGGMALLRKRPLESSHEFLVATGGPILSISIAGLFYLLTLLQPQELSTFMEISRFIIYSNLVLGIFNLIPIFPLDGGRALRAILWQLLGKYYRASVTAYRTGALLIAALYALTITSFFIYSQRITFWLALIALYLSYTAIRGKNELISIPSTQKLLWKPDAPATPAILIEAIFNRNSAYLRDAIIPVILEGEFKYIIHGKDIYRDFASENAHFNIEKYLRYPAPGTYIDTFDRNSFSKQIQFKATWIPVFQDNEFYGFADADEIRFWLLELLHRRGYVDLNQQ